MPIFNDKTGYEIIQTYLEDNLDNNLFLADPSPEGNNIDGDMVWWENEYARLEIYPHTSRELITQTQYANVTWKYPDNNIDLVFRFPFNIGNADIWLWQNISHNVTVADYGQVERNYTLYDISDIQIITDPEHVDFGDNTSTYYRQGNASYFEIMDEQWINDTFIIGFDSYEWLNPEQTNATFYYNEYGQTGSHIEEQYFFDWNSQRHRFNYNYSHDTHNYYVTNVPVKQNHSYRLKWQYDTPIGSSDKWLFMGKLSSDTIQEALDTGRYVMIDPWWNNDWQYYKRITLSNAVNDYQMLINVTNTSGGDVNCSVHAKSDFSDVRFTTIGNVSIPFWIERQIDSSYCHFWVKLPGTATTDNAINIYYGYGTATNASNGNETFVFYDDFNDTDMDDTKWDKNQDAASCDFSTEGYVALSNDARIATDDEFGPSVRIRSYAHSSEQDTNWYYISEVPIDATNRINLLNSDKVENNDFDDYTYQTEENDANKKTTSTTNLWDWRAYGSYEITWVTTDTYIYVNDVEYFHHTHNVVNNSQHIYHGVWDSSQESTLTVDWTFVSNYTATEPSVSSVGAEQTQGAAPPANNEPTFSSETPSNSTAYQQPNLTWSITINDPDGDQFNYSINCSNGDTSTWVTDVSNGTYSLSITSLDYDTWYTVYVNATDGVDNSGNWTRQWYTFKTRSSTMASDNGILEYLNKPCAIYYSGTYERTYIGFIDNAGQVRVKYYNHTTDIFSDEVYITTEYVDDHHAPTLVINQTGHLLLFWIDDNDGHTGTIMCNVSSNPEDIESFQTAVVVDGLGGTYPKPFINSSDTCYVTYRNGAASKRNVNISYASAPYTSWTTTTLMSFTGTNTKIYQMQYQEVADPDTVHVCAVYLDGVIASTARQDFYYMQTDDGGNSWQNISGDALSLPVDYTNMDLAWDENDNVRQLDIMADQYGYPHMLGNKDINDDNSPPLYHVWWDGAEWHNEDTGISCDVFYNAGQSNAYSSGACFDRKDTDVIYVGVVNSTFADVHAFTKTRDTWSKVRELTSGAADYKIRPMPVYNRSNEFGVLWSNGTYTDSANYNTELHYSNATIHTPVLYWTTLYDWNGTLYNSSSWHTLYDWNGSLFNSSSWHTLYDWNGTLYNASTFQTLYDWNGTLYNSSIYHTLYDWNGTLFNSSMFQTLYDWNGTLYNSSGWQSLFDWNGSLYNSSVFQTLFDWNGSLYNVTAFETLYDWNGTLYNSSVFRTLFDWNGSLYNVTAFETLYDWNGTLYNTSIYQTLYDWNGSLFNSSSWHTLYDWNGTLYNSSVFQTLYDWNGTLYNITAYQTLYDWNGTLYNSSGWLSLQDWNGTLYNSSLWQTLYDWNGTLYNSSGWLSLQDWNGTLYNSSGWLSLQDWNGTLYNSSVFQTLYDWNGTLYNGTGSVCNGSCSGTRYEYSDQGNDDLILNDVDEYGGQTFMLNQTITLTCIRIMTYKVGNPGNITVNITNTTDSPSIPHVSLSSGTLNISDVETSYCWLPVTITPVTLTANIEYAINISVETADNSNYIRLRCDTGGNNYYTNGHLFVTTDGGITWIAPTGYDLFFEVYGTLPPFTVSSQYPNASGIPLQPTAYATITHSHGETFNINWYYGNSSENTTNLLGTETSLTNGTRTQAFYPMQNYFTTYWWRLYTEDGTNHTNFTYSFRTESDAGTVKLGRSYQSYAIALVGVIMAIAFILILSRRRRY